MLYNSKTPFLLSRRNIEIGSPPERQGSFYDKEVIKILNGSKSFEKLKKNNETNEKTFADDPVLIYSQMKESMNLILNNMEKLQNINTNINIKSHLASRNSKFNAFEKTLNMKNIVSTQYSKKGMITNNISRENTTRINKIYTPFVKSLKTSQIISKNNTTINSPNFRQKGGNINIKKGFSKYTNLSHETNTNPKVIKKTIQINNDNTSLPYKNIGCNSIKSPIKISRTPTKSEVILFSKTKPNSLSYKSTFPSKEKASRNSSSLNKGSINRKDFPLVDKINSKTDNNTKLINSTQKGINFNSCLLNEIKSINKKITNLQSHETKIINIKIYTNNAKQYKDKYDFKGAGYVKSKKRDVNSLDKSNKDNNLSLYSKKHMFPLAQTTSITNSNVNTSNNNCLKLESIKKNTSNLVPTIHTSLHNETNNNDSDNNPYKKRKNFLTKLSDARKSKKRENISSNSSSVNNMLTEDKKNFVTELEEFRNSTQLKKRFSYTREKEVQQKVNKRYNNLKCSSSSVNLNRRNTRNNFIGLSLEEDTQKSNNLSLNLTDNVNEFFFCSGKLMKKDICEKISTQLHHTKNTESRLKNLSSNIQSFSGSQMVKEVEIEILGHNNIIKTNSKFKPKDSKKNFNFSQDKKSFQHTLRMNKKFSMTKERETFIAK